jgi:hypothetical protein
MRPGRGNDAHALTGDDDRAEIKHRMALGERSLVGNW